MTDRISTQIRDGVAEITLNSPDDDNALRPELLDGIIEAVDAAEADSTVKAIALRAEGTVFSSGAALDIVAKFGMDSIAGRLVEAQRRLVASPLPTVAVVEATVMAGGFGLVAACDIAIAADDVDFRFTEVRNAVAPAAISMTVLARTNPRLITDLMLTGRTFTAREAVDAGVITRTVPRGVLEEQVARTLSDLTDASAQGLRETKKLLNADIHAALITKGGERAALGAKLFNTDEAQKRLLAE
ncbi:enoyl-CoA hydratase-related protein [Rhodococcus opacus]|uniref:enoyl-CoA hydratase-related protein n=1 Tax=Rhodococcus opacus TaxID=37919 RepID=UPI001C47B90A|nr:enoyl-CoA hydratase-related protein [Rhodococcus opacus]MBV6760245.1 enoyl-CoA hydratase/isomerase family protein [Rhodococcus opacus]